MAKKIKMKKNTGDESTQVQMAAEAPKRKKRRPKKRITIVKPSQLDMKNPGGWPLFPYQILAWIVLGAVVAFVYNVKWRKPIMENIASLDATIEKKKNEHDQKFTQTRNIAVYEQRSADLKEVFKNLLVYLPLGTEMPSLLQQTGTNAKENAIQFLSFTPNYQGTKSEYYTTIPVSLSVVNQFPNVTNFIQSISALDRILNLANIDIKDTNSTRDTSNLDIKAQLETYIYTTDLKSILGEEEAIKVMEDVRQRQREMDKQRGWNRIISGEPLGSDVFENPSETTAADAAHTNEESAQ